ICSRSHQQGHKVVPAFRQQRRLPTFHSAAFSWNGTCCILLDRFGTMFVYDVTSNHPLTGGGGEVEVASSSAFASLLESSLVLGLDSLDVLVTLKPTMATEVAEKLNESLCKQPQSIQDFYRIVAMILRMNLLKMSPLASSKATSGALHTLILLHSVAAAFRGTLRPSDLPTSQGPAEALAELLSKGTSDQSNDLNKVCCQLEPREFSVEGATLQSLQPLIQWVGDLALTLVLSAPHINSSVASPATELLKNRGALNIIRELLVVIRLWGYLRSSCLPNFSTADCHIQALNILFRILSRLALSTGWEHDDAFLDLLPTRWVVAILSFCACFCTYANRVNLNIAIVTMVNYTAIGLEQHQEEAHTVCPENSEAEKKLSEKGVFFPAMTAMLARWVPPLERSTITAMVFSGAHVGTVATLGLSGFIIDGLGWESPFYICGGLTVVWFFMWMYFVSGEPSDHPRISEEEKTYIVESLKEEQHDDYKPNGVLNAMPYLILFVLGNLISYASDEIRKKELLTTTTLRKVSNTLVHLGTAICFVVMGYSECNYTLVIIFFFIAGACQAGMYSSFLVNNLDIASNFAGTMFGITNSLATIPGWVAPLVTGAVLQGQPTFERWRIAFWIAIALLLFNAIFYLLFGTAEEQSWNREESKVDKEAELRRRKSIVAEEEILKEEERFVPVM
ncbi:unnamed protein product, partial [Cyprideis torosa]